MTTEWRASEVPTWQAPAARLRNLWMAAAVGLPPLALLAPTLLVPAFFMLVTLALLVGHWGGLRPLVPWCLAILVLVLVAWGATTAFWALDSAISLQRAAKLALVTVAGILLIAAARIVPEQDRPAIAWSLLVGYVLALVIAVVVLLASGAIDPGGADRPLRLIPVAGASYKRGLSVLFLFAWVLAAGLAAVGRPRLGGLCLAIPPLVMLAMRSEASVFAWGCGMVGLLVGGLLSRRALLALAPLTGLYAMLTPFLARLIPTDLSPWASALPFSALHRLAAWRFTAERVFERPLFGWGLENSRILPGGNEPAGLAAFIAERPPDGRNLSKLIETLTLDPPSILPVHPHNFTLQIWVELGVLGIALSATVLVFLLLTLVRAPQTRWQRGFGLGLFLAVATVASLSFGAWQTWWHATFWILAAFTVIFSSPVEPTHEHAPA